MILPQSSRHCLRRGARIFIGPVHLEQMGSLEGVAQAKAELIVGLYDGATAVVPSDEPLLEPWLREALEVVTLRAGRRRR